MTNAADTPARDAQLGGNGASSPVISSPDERDRSVSFAEVVHAHSERQRELAGGRRGRAVGGRVPPPPARVQGRPRHVRGRVLVSVRVVRRRDHRQGRPSGEEPLPPRLDHAPARRDRLAHGARSAHRRDAPRVGDARDPREPRCCAGRASGSRCSRSTPRAAACSPSSTGSDRRLRARRSCARSSACTLRELRAVTKYYERAAENQARIVYFQGMAWGGAILGALVGARVPARLGARLARSGASVSTQVFFVTLAMGATGAMLSVMTRMAKAHGFNIDYEVGRKPARFLGALRPWIGAMFALALYIAIRGGVVAVLPEAEQTVYFFAAIAFLAGFSERWAKVLLDGASGGDDERRDESPRMRAGEAVTSVRAEVGRRGRARDDDAAAAQRDEGLTSRRVGAEQERQHRLLDVQPVLGLVPDRRLRPVEHVGGDLLPGVRRQAVEDDRLAARRARAATRRGGTARGRGGAAPRRRLVAHRHPRVGDEHVRSGRRLARVAHDLDSVGGSYPPGRGDDELEPEQRREAGERDADVRAVAEPRDADALGRAEPLADSQRVGERLARVLLLGERVDHGDRGGVAPTRRRRPAPASGSRSRRGSARGRAPCPPATRRARAAAPRAGAGPRRRRAASSRRRTRPGCASRAW